MKKSNKETVMKRIFQLIGIILLFTACQLEEVIVKNPENEGAIGARTSLADLVLQTTMNDGSFDNIIDNSSCLSVKLPVTVEVNGVTMQIDSASNFIDIERIFDESVDDIDTLTIIFPITVILADFTEVIVNSEEEMEDLVEDCVEGGEDLDIECLDFIYPINVSFYDSANQLVDAIILNNDEDLFELIDSMDENELISIEFPISVLVSDSVELVVNNNFELEEIIETYADQCDEDDDNDYGDDDIDDSGLVSLLLSGEWVVAEFVDEVDHTDIFQGYFFSFMEDGSGLARKGDENTTGQWKSYGDDGVLELELDFGSGYPLEELEEGWMLSGMNDSTIYLVDEGDDGFDAFLTLRIANESDTTTYYSLSDIITEGTWSITQYVESDTIRTELFDNYTLSFTGDSLVIASNGIDNIDGRWLEILEDNGHRFEFVFNEIEPFDRLNEDWDIISYTTSKLKLEKEDSESNSKDKLIIEKLP